MTDPTSPSPDAVQPTIADTVIDPGMAPMDDAAGGPTADRSDDLDEMQEPDAGLDAGDVATQLGDFA